MYLAVVFDVAVKPSVSKRLSLGITVYALASKTCRYSSLATHRLLINAQGRGRVSARTRPHWLAPLSPATGRLCHLYKRSPKLRIPDGKAKKGGNPCYPPEWL